MLVILAFQASKQSAHIRANIKPPLEVVVTNLASLWRESMHGRIEKIGFQAIYIVWINNGNCFIDLLLFEWAWVLL